MGNNSSLPVSGDAEKGLLSSFLQSPIDISDLCSHQGVTEEWFHSSPDNRILFRVLGDMVKSQEAVDFVTATHFILAHPTEYPLLTPDLHVFITELFTFIPTATNASYYITIMRETHVRRMALVDCITAQKQLEQAHTTQEVFNITSNAFTKVLETCQEKENSSNWRKEEFISFINEMEEAATNQSRKDMIHFDIPQLDEASGGMERGELVVIHGLTSTGKSLFGSHIMACNVFQRGMKAQVFSAEMPHKQYLRRLTSNLGSISLTSMRTGKFTKNELSSFMSTVSKIESSPLWVLDVKRNKMTPETVAAAMRRQKKNQGVDIVIIDNLQNLQVRGTKAKDLRPDEMWEAVAAGFKYLAMELDIVVILLAQSGEKGMVHGCPQVESYADWVLGMLPVYKMISGIKRVTGTDGIFISKGRECERGIKIPITMKGEYARISQSLPQEQS